MTSAAADSIWVPVRSLWGREIIRFVRQRSRVVGALATPIVFWALLGFGLGQSFRASGAPGRHGYLQYFFPGTLVMILLFSSIFSTISVIEDRASGFLQSVLVAPIPRYVLVLGNILGGTTLAVVQAAILLLAGPLIGFPLGIGGYLLTVFVMTLVAFGLTCLGFFIAWRLHSTQGFHAIMNLLLIPMWLLSGAVFPPTGAPAGLQWLMRLNPTLYGVAAVQRCLYPASISAGMALPAWSTCLAVVLGFDALAFWACARAANRPGMTWA